MLTIVRDYPVEEFLPLVNKKWLFGALWQVKPEDIASAPDVASEIETAFERMSGWAREIVCGAFSHTTAEPFYQVVTIGAMAVEKAHSLKDTGDYVDYFYWHGFCAALTEALAEKVHNLAFPQNPRRLSYGYPALPNLEEQRPIIALLEADKIGVSMTDAGMLVPEYSTCAVVL